MTLSTLILINVLKKSELLVAFGRVKCIYYYTAVLTCIDLHTDDTIIILMTDYRANMTSSHCNVIILQRTRQLNCKRQSEQSHCMNDFKLDTFESLLTTSCDLSNVTTSIRTNQIEVVITEDSNSC